MPVTRASRRNTPSVSANIDNPAPESVQVTTTRRSRRTLGNPPEIRSPLTATTSRAYGAQGSTPIPERVRVGGGNRSFAAVFEQERVDAHSRRSSSPAQAPSTVPPSPSPHPTASQHGSSEAGAVTPDDLDDVMIQNGNHRWPVWLMFAGLTGLVMMLCALALLLRGSSFPNLTAIPSSLHSLGVKLPGAALPSDPTESATGLAARVRVPPSDPKVASAASRSFYMIDWFSGNRGAVIIPEYTTPTLEERPQKRAAVEQLKSRTSWMTATRWTLAFARNRRTVWPFKVLMPWVENGECWCTTSPEDPPFHPNTEPSMAHDYALVHRYGTGVADPRGMSLPGAPRAQFAVAMGTQIYPTAAVVEHVPRQGTNEISAAPEWMEVWVYNTDGAARARIFAAYSAATGEHALAWPEYTREQIGVLKNLVFAPLEQVGYARFWFNYWFGARSAQLDQLPFAGRAALGKEWIRVSRFRYDIHAGAHIQEFPIPVDFEALGITVDQMAVRARSNYGGPHTCLYRVRMYGKEAH